MDFNQQAQRVKQPVNQRVEEDLFLITKSEMVVSLILYLAVLAWKPPRFIAALMLLLFFS